MKRFTSFVLALAMAVSLVSNVTAYAEQGSVPETEDTTVTEDSATTGSQKTKTEKQLSLNRTELNITAGKTYLLKVKNAKFAVKWKTSDKKVATVAEDGTVTAKNPGDVVITATTSGKKFECSVRVYATKSHVEEWLEYKGEVYYYNEYGEKATGRQEIGGKTYFFESNGQQRVGWVNEGDDYYFYNIDTKEKGYMLKSQVVNGIALNNSGKAKVKESNSMKIAMLAASADMVSEYTEIAMDKQAKLKVMYELLAKGSIITYRNLGDKVRSDWDTYYGGFYFERGYGNCYTVGIVVAYFATAIGFTEAYAERSSGHGWARVDGKYYDANWAWWGTNNIYDAYAVSPELSGKGGRPNWAKYATYVKKIS